MTVPLIDFSNLSSHADPAAYLSQLLAPYDAISRRNASFALIKQILARWDDNFAQFRSDRPAAQALLEVFTSNDSYSITNHASTDFRSDDWEAVEVFSRLCSLIEYTNLTYTEISLAAKAANKSLEQIRRKGRCVSASAGALDHQEPTWSSFPYCIPYAMRSARATKSTTGLFGKEKLQDWFKVAKVATVVEATTFLRKQLVKEDAKLKKPRTIPGTKRDADEEAYLTGHMDRCPSKKSLVACWEHFAVEGRAESESSNDDDDDDDEDDDADDDAKDDAHLNKRSNKANVETEQDEQNTGTTPAGRRPQNQDAAQASARRGLPASKKRSATDAQTTQPQRPTKRPRVTSDSTSTKQSVHFAKAASSSQHQQPFHGRSRRLSSKVECGKPVQDDINLNGTS